MDKHDYNIFHFYCYSTYIICRVAVTIQPTITVHVCVYGTCQLVQAPLIKTTSFYHTQPYGKTHECTLYTHVIFYFPNTYLCTHVDKHFL